MDAPQESFIDADAGFSNDKNSYDGIILKQIQNCVDVLSREMTGGQVIHKASNTGVEKYVEDVRELVINHVDSLKMLMANYIKGKNKTQIKKILTEIEEYKKDMGEKKVLIKGQGYIQVKDIKTVYVDSPIWKEYINYKSQKYREVFEVLILIYNNSKAEIKKLEEE